MNFHSYLYALEDLGLHGNVKSYSVRTYKHYYDEDGNFVKKRKALYLDNTVDMLFNSHGSLIFYDYGVRINKPAVYRDLVHYNEQNQLIQKIVICHNPYFYKKDYVSIDFYHYVYQDNELIKMINQMFYYPLELIQEIESKFFANIKNQRSEPFEFSSDFMLNFDERIDDDIDMSEDCYLLIKPPQKEEIDKELNDKELNIDELCFDAETGYKDVLDGLKLSVYYRENIDEEWRLTVINLYDEQHRTLERYTNYLGNKVFETKEMYEYDDIHHRETWKKYHYDEDEQDYFLTDTWTITETYDDKNNLIDYFYLIQDSEGINQEATQIVYRIEYAD